MLAFLEEYGFSSARCELLSKMSRYAEAAEIRLNEFGDYVGAIDLFLRAGDSSSQQRAVSCTISGFWGNFHLGTLSSTSAKARQLLTLSGRLSQTHVSSDQEQEVGYKPQFK